MKQDILDIIATGFFLAACAFIWSYFDNRPEEPAPKTKAERQANFKQSVYRLHDQYLNDNPKLKRLIERGE